MKGNSLETFKIFQKSLTVPKNNQKGDALVLSDFVCYALKMEQRVPFALSLMRFRGVRSILLYVQKFFTWSMPIFSTQSLTVQSVDTDKQEGKMNFK